MITLLAGAGVPIGLAIILGAIFYCCCNDENK